MIVVEDKQIETGGRIKHMIVVERGSMCGRSVLWWREGVWEKCMHCGGERGCGRRCCGSRVCCGGERGCGRKVHVLHMVERGVWEERCAACGGERGVGEVCCEVITLGLKHNILHLAMQYKVSEGD